MSLTALLVSAGAWAADPVQIINTGTDGVAWLDVGAEHVSQVQESPTA